MSIPPPNSKRTKRDTLSNSGEKAFYTAIDSYSANLLYTAQSFARRDRSAEITELHVEEARKSLTKARRISRWRSVALATGSLLLGISASGVITDLTEYSYSHQLSVGGLVTYLVMGFLGTITISLSLLSED